MHQPVQPAINAIQRGDKRMAFNVIWRTSYQKSDLILAGFISLLHLSVATIYIRFIGVSIRLDAPWGTWDWFWQNLPLDNLKNDLWHSLWFLHAQPPMFNLLGGILAKLFYPHHLEALHLFNVLLGSLLSGLVYLLAVHFTSRRTIAVVWAFLISQNLSLYLYEAFILYSLLTAFLVVLNLSCILWYQHTKSAAALYCFIGTLNLLILTRGVYHIILIPVALGFVWLIAEKGRRAKIVFLCMVICLVSVFWYAKNYSLFGFFGASSWAGQSLWRIASFGYSEKELQVLSEVGLIDQMVTERTAFLRPSAYETFGFEKRSAIKVLSNNDFNNINIPEVSAMYGKNALRLIRYHPWTYIRSVIQAYLGYCLPSSSYDFLALNFNKIGYPEKSFVYSLQFLETAILPVLLPAALLFYLAQIFSDCAQHQWDFSQTLQKDSVLFWCFFMILYSTVVTCMLEIGENNRFKFDVEQLIWLFIPVVLSRVRRSTALAKSILEKPLIKRPAQPAVLSGGTIVKSKVSH
jgi:4-amino-4-deoxy-L-arabinose transferase-like glycosyltransferase